MKAPIAVALDAADLKTAVSWAAQCRSTVSTVKVGLETYLRDGANGVAAVREAAPDCALFLDLKLHDIPNTVAGAARSIASLEPNLLTVHATGGAAMIEAAAAALPNCRIAAVTILTSLSEADVRAIGWTGSPQQAVVKLARLAVDSGAQALVCSPAEVALVRAEVGPDVLLVTPGVRPVGAAVQDQVRVTTPAQAVADGADLLVIGRPITAAADPAAAAGEIAATLK